MAAKPKTQAKPAKTSTRTRNSQSIKNIKRIDSTKTHGWQVHVRRGGELRTKLFSDRVWKGKRKALQAAKDYRDGLLEEMAPLAKPLWKIDRTPKTNTGHLGASYTEYANRSGKKRGVITVTVREALGKPVNRKFSVDKLGYDEALRQAVEWREQVLAERERRESGHSARKEKPKAAAPVEAKSAKVAAKPKKTTKPASGKKPAKSTRR